MWWPQPILPLGMCTGREMNSCTRVSAKPPTWDSHSETWPPQPPALCFQQPPSTPVNLQASGCGPRNIGPGEPPYESMSGDTGHSLPPEVLCSGRKVGQGKHFRVHTETVFYKVPVFKERCTARGLPLDFILTRQAAAVARPETGAWAANPCPLGNGARPTWSHPRGHRCC